MIIHNPAEYAAILATLRPQARARETCPHGHLWTPDNTRWRYRIHHWERECVTCRYASKQRAHQKRAHS